MVGRREFVVATSATAAYALFPFAGVEGSSKMHGLIGKMLASPGKRDELIKILVDGVFREEIDVWCKLDS